MFVKADSGIGQKDVIFRSSEDLYYISGIYILRLRVESVMRWKKGYVLYAYDVENMRYYRFDLYQRIFGKAFIHNCITSTRKKAKIKRFLLLLDQAYRSVGRIFFADYGEKNKSEDIKIFDGVKEWERDQESVCFTGKLIGQ